MDSLNSPECVKALLYRNSFASAAPKCALIYYIIMDDLYKPLKVSSLGISPKLSRKVVQLVAKELLD